MEELEKKPDLKNVPETRQRINSLGRWAGFFIDRHRIVYLLIVAVLIWGITGYFELKRELSTQMTLPYGIVLTTYTGAAPEEMEKLVTDKVEKKMDELERVKKITSTSGYGHSTVFLEFETGMDMESATQKMREKVFDVQKDLPAEADPPQVYKVETNNAPIMIVNISGDYDQAALKSYGEKLRTELEKLREIADVQIIGGVEREIRVIVDPEKLSVYNISPEQIQNAIATSNVNLPGGDIQLDNRVYNIRTVGEIKQAERVGNIVLAYINNKPLYLKEIARIEDGYADIQSYSRMSYGLRTDRPGVKKSVALVVKKKREADIIQTSNKVHEILQNHKGRYPDLEVVVSGDTADQVRSQLGTVFDGSRSGLLLVLVVLFLFIGFKQSLVVAFVIPLSLFMTFGLMNATEMTLNEVTLFALMLAVGMLVDNGIVMMENINRLRSLGMTSKEAARLGANQIAPAIASSTLTTMVAFFPIMLTPGILGTMLKPLPQTVIFALSASFFVVVTVTPELCAKVLKRRSNNGTGGMSKRLQVLKKIVPIFVVMILTMYAFRDSEGGMMGFGILSVVLGMLFAAVTAIKVQYGGKSKKDNLIIRNYGECLYRIIKHKSRRRAVIALVVLAVALSMSLIPLGFLRVEMVSPTDSERIYINIKTANGTRLDQTSELVAEVEKRLFQFPEIKSFVSNIGMTGADSLDQFQISSSGSSNMARIILDLFAERERERSSMEIGAELRRVLQDIPGAEINIEDSDGGPTTGRPIVVRLKGEKLEELKRIGDDFACILQGINGARDVKNSMTEGAPEIQVRVNKEKAAFFGLDEMTVALGIRNAVHGLKATTLRMDQDEIDVVIRTAESKLETIGDLERIYFHARSGRAIPFAQAASIVEETGLLSISHEDLKRQIEISAELVAGVVANEVIYEFEETIADYPLPEGVMMEYGGEIKEMQESFTAMFRNLGIAALLVFLILTVQFNSLSQPLIILFTVPLAMIGVMPAHALTGYNFGFFSFIGMVALVGIVVNNGIVLVDYINYLRKNGHELYEAVKKTGMTRFIPVIATTITTAGGILPMTLKEPFFVTLCYTLIFGLGAATVLTLVVIPVLYVSLEEFMEAQKRKKLKGEKDDEEIISNTSTPLQ